LPKTSTGKVRKFDLRERAKGVNKPGNPAGVRVQESGRLAPYIIEL
jgi:hypothetical protein